MGIDAPHAVDIATWQNAGEVSRPVDTANLRERDKLLGCQLWAVSVAKGKARTCDAELARIARLYRLKRVIQNECLEVADRLSDHNGYTRQNLGTRCGHRTLGRSVAIDEPAARRPCIHNIRWQCLPANVNDS